MRELPRRTAFAAIASAAVVPGVAPAVMEDDPIYAAIEAHKAAHIEFARHLDVFCCLLPPDPGYDRIDAATSVASAAADDAGIYLSNVVPTTMAGTLALLDYIDEFNLGNACKGTSHTMWPDELVCNDTLTAKGWPLEMPFAFWIMRNVQEALQTITLQQGSQAVMA